MKRKIVITGATGLIGGEICRKLHEKGDEITIFTRGVNKGRALFPFLNNIIEWDYNKPETWRNELNGKDAIIHLAGANVFGERWSSRYKRIIMESRRGATRNLVESIGLINNRPKVFISSSAVGYYGSNGDEELTEGSPAGTDFLSTVCQEWEYEAKQVERYGVRRVSIRTGIVLSAEEGALKRMLLPYKMFAGGSLGRGGQWFPWIHIDDIVNVYLYALENELAGEINGTSPNPVTMKEFARTLGKVLHRPSFLSVPEFIIKLAVGEGAESILSSLRVMPQKLIKNSFKFKYEHLEPALISLLKI
ncbi:MAG: TIGR01777 family oxidoreductase [Ignavibacteriaceae bacterium]|nr:TIGR01777 family oxidoreductase [Ignavibacteriaceae bacterium]